MAKQVILERVEPFNKVIDEPFAKLIGDDEGVAPRSRSAPGVDDRDERQSYQAPVGIRGYAALLSEP